MLILVVASIFPYQVLGSPSPIVGGQFSKIENFPWLASIQTGGYHKCVGSVISDKVILTASHCVVDRRPDAFIVRVGSSRTDSGGTWHRVVDIITNLEYGIMVTGHAFCLNDVALLRVEPPIELGNNVRKIQLAGKGYRLLPGDKVRVAGWGSNTTTGPVTMELNAAELQIIDSAACSRTYGYKRGNRMKLDHLLCAAQYGRDSCVGDSGGPLVDENDVQVGIVSTGIGCANPRYPGVYTEVGHYRDWININSLFLEKSKYSSTTPDPSTLPGPITNATFSIPSVWGTPA